MNKLTLQHINKHYGKTHVLHDITDELEPGIHALLGPNGAGKSTLMNLITDNLAPDAGGQILWNGTDIHALSKEYRQCLGYMPQQQTLYPTMTAWRFMGYMAALNGIPRKKANSEIEALLNMVELGDCADRKIGGFSGGMKQRLLFASALLGQPDLLILDEPTAGLDPRQRVILRKLIEELSHDKIILISTHITSDVESIADRILMLKEGRLIQSGTLASIAGANAPVSLEALYMQYYGEEAAQKEDGNDADSAG